MINTPAFSQLDNDMRLAQALSQLAEAKTRYERLLKDNVFREMLLSDALAHERAWRLDLQARVAQLEWQLQHTSFEEAALQERTVGE